MWGVVGIITTGQGRFPEEKQHLHVRSRKTKPGVQGESVHPPADHPESGVGRGAAFLGGKPY